ncbi:30S ribosomal protein S6e [archaeon]|jgi:small subunit ribosomal protein S6e|nr:30S ribosomal protein S6e [archaeon]
MPFKINVAKDGKTFKAETDNEELVNLRIGDNVEGKMLSDDLEGYELEITGTSDKAGFCGLASVQGARLKKVLLSYETGMHRRPKKEGKKVRSNVNPKGLRLRKTVRGNEISLDTVQINTKVLKEGKKKFDALFEAPAAPEGEATEEKKE